jgi:hypothetical protein
MATTYTVVGDLQVAGSVKGEEIAEQVLVDWPAKNPALIEGGHIENLAGGGSAPVDPAPVSPDAPQEG